MYEKESYLFYIFNLFLKCIIIKITICHVTDIQGNQNQTSLAGKLGKFLKLLYNNNIQFINVVIP